MHPTKLLALENLKIIDPDFPGIITPMVREYMKDVHPTQFIESDFETMLFELHVSYINQHNKYMETKKYIFLQEHEDNWMQAQVILDRWKSQLEKQSPFKKIRNLEINKIIKIGRMVLPIG